MSSALLTTTDPTSMHDEPSRSYVGLNNNSMAMPIVTTYEDDHDMPINARKSVAGSTRAPTIQRAGSVDQGSVRSPTIRQTGDQTSVRSPTLNRAVSSKVPTINRPPSVAGTNRPGSVRTAKRQESMTGTNRPPSVAESARDVAEGAIGGTAIGQVMSPSRQRELQHSNAQPLRNGGRTSLSDQGVVGRERNTTFDDRERATSPRPMSPFGHRPQPNLMSVAEDGRESRYDNGRDSRAGVLGRSGTVLSRAQTQGRNGTLSRATNGGTVGNRRGAFGRGAGASIGTQPEEVLGRE